MWVMMGCGATRGLAHEGAGDDEQPKGRKRLRGRKGRTAKGNRLKGDVSLSAAAGSTGTVAEWDGTDTGRKKKTKESVAD